MKPVPKDLSPRAVRLGGLGAAFLSVALFGCDPSGAAVVPVRGTVTRNGRPVPDLCLNFLPAQGRPSWGVTDEAGRFVLHHDPSRDGAVPGLHIVFVTYKPGDRRAGIDSQLSARNMPPDLIPILAKYGRPDQTPLRVEIKTDIREIALHLD